MHLCAKRVAGRLVVGRLRPLLAGMLAMGLVACAAIKPEPAATPFELPASFAAAPHQVYEISERWWEEFADPELNTFVESALVSNPGLGQALARTRIAAAQARINRADQLPQIGLGAGSTRQRQNMPDLMTGETAPVISNNHNLALDVSWELDLWGRLAALSAAARSDYLASTEQLRAVRQSVAAQAVQLYFEIVHAQAQVGLSERTVKALAEMSRQINNRVDVGIASPADGALARANLGSAQAGLEQRREALQRTLRQLQVLTGAYPDGQLGTAEQLPRVPAAPAAGVPSEMLARRPDVRAADLALQSAGYQLGAARRSFLPSLSLTGSGGYAGPEFSQLLDGNNLIWSIGGRVLQPVFQGGRLVAQVDLAQGRRDEALQAYAEIALTALSEAESALAVDVLLTDREAALERSARAAEEAVGVSFNRYQQGIDPFLNVLESQQRALDGRSAQISARLARIENRIALHLALGGGFENGAVPDSLDATSATPSTGR